MSYILEALKKSERERRLGQVPSLPSLELETAPKRPRRLLWAFAALLLTVNAGVLAYFWLRGPGQTQSSPPAAAVPTPAAPVAEATPQPQLEQKLRDLEKRLAELNPAPSASTAPEPSAAKPPTRQPPSRSRRETVATVGEPVQEAASRPMARRKAAEPVDEQAEDELPKEIRALKINVLAYSADPSERFAVINMSRHVPGDRLSGGVILVDILPDGLSLELDGARYRINR